VLRLPTAGLAGAGAEGSRPRGARQLARARRGHTGLWRLAPRARLRRVSVTAGPGGIGMSRAVGVTTGDRRRDVVLALLPCLFAVGESSQIPRKVYVHNLSSRTDDSYLTSSGPSALSHLASTSASQRRSSKPAAAAAVASASQQRGVRPASATAASASCIAPSACAICARARERPMSASMSHES